MPSLCTHTHNVTGSSSCLKHSAPYLFCCVQVPVREIAVIAPYNAQVALVKKMLIEGSENAEAGSTAALLSLVEVTGSCVLQSTLDHWMAFFLACWNRATMYQKSFLCVGC